MSGNSVYLGSWVNHSNGQVLGATLTIPVRYGVFLTNFLALFVSWTGIQVWSIFCYCIHLTHSTAESRDAFHHQRQALLRIGYTDYTFFWRLLKLSWAQSAARRTSAFRRSTPLALLALGHVALFTTAGILSSRVTETNSEALVRSPTGSCGQPDFNALNFIQANDDLVSKANAMYIISNWAFERSRDYANSCYRTDSNFTAASCDAYIRPRLQSYVTRNDSCPFQEACMAPAITVSTGYVDSSSHVGLNTPASDRVQFEKRLTCAPLNTTKYSTEWMSPGPTKIFPWDPDNVPGASYKFYHFGNQTIFGLNGNYTFAEGNFTAAVSQAYTTDVRGALIGEDSFSGFNPVPELNRTDADVSLWSLRNRVMYTGPVYDPWYKATTPKNIGLSQVWTADEPVSAIGCVEQYSFCNQQNCTTLAALSQFTPELVARDLGYSPMQLAIFKLMWRATWTMRLSSLIFQLQDYALLAKSQVWGEYKVSSPLPDDQWQLEVENVFNISLALLQMVFVVNAAPPRVKITPTSTYDQYLTKPNTTETQLLCMKQKIKSANVASFNLFGVLFILVGGTTLIILSHLIPSVVEKRQGQSSNPVARYERDEWNSNDVLHLQKAALESHGIGPWTGKGGEVPILHREQKFKLPWISTEEQQVALVSMPGSSDDLDYGSHVQLVKPRLK